MYSRKTTMTRLINRLIERTVSLVSARPAPPKGPMQTMLTSPLGQAGIRPLPALAAKPLADAQERRGAMRISKRFKLSLMAALVGLTVHSGLVAATEVGPVVGDDQVVGAPESTSIPIMNGEDSVIIDPATGEVALSDIDAYLLFYIGMDDDGVRDAGGDGFKDIFTDVEVRMMVSEEEAAKVASLGSAAPKGAAEKKSPARPTYSKEGENPPGLIIIKGNGMAIWGPKPADTDFPQFVTGNPLGKWDGVWPPEKPRDWQGPWPPHPPRATYSKEGENPPGLAIIKPDNTTIWGPKPANWPGVWPPEKPRYWLGAWPPNPITDSGSFTRPRTIFGTAPAYTGPSMTAGPVRGSGGRMTAYMNALSACKVECGAMPQVPPGVSYGAAFNGILGGLNANLNGFNPIACITSCMRRKGF